MRQAKMKLKMRTSQLLDVVLGRNSWLTESP
jgi:hypothetical protein